MNLLKKSIIVICLFCVSLVVVYKIEAFKGRPSATVSFSSIPLNVGNWKGKDIAIEENVYDILETRDVLTRSYTDAKGNVVYLAIVYAQNNRGSLHPPEICYLGGGVKLLDKRIEPVTIHKKAVLQTNKLVMQAPEGVLTALYWFSAGTKFVNNYYMQQIYVLSQALKGRSLRGALLRVSGSNEGVIKGFIREIYPYLENFFKLT